MLTNQIPHCQLGGGFGPGFKVAGGYDLVGDGGKWSNSRLFILQVVRDGALSVRLRTETNTPLLPAWPNGPKEPDSDPFDAFGGWTTPDVCVLVGENDWYVDYDSPWLSKSLYHTNGRVPTAGTLASPLKPQFWSTRSTPG